MRREDVARRAAVRKIAEGRRKPGKNFTKPAARPVAFADAVETQPEATVRRAAGTRAGGVKLIPRRSSDRAF